MLGQRCSKDIVRTVRAVAWWKSNGKTAGVHAVEGWQKSFGEPVGNSAEPNAIVRGWERLRGQVEAGSNVGTYRDSVSSNGENFEIRAFIATFEV